MRRSAREKAIVDRRVREYVQLNRSTLSSAQDAPEVVPGRFRKRAPHDCGRTQCKLCHRDKIFGVPNRQQLVAQAVTAYELADL